MANNFNRSSDVRENVVAGAVGALLFSLVGGIVWFLLWQVGFIAGISGAIGVICAIKGYTVFGKKESIKGVVISIIATLIVMVIAWYLCLSMDVFNAYKDWQAEGLIGYTLTFSESVQNAYIFLEDPEISGVYIKNLLFGLVFCVIGGIGYVMGTVKRVKENEAIKESVASEPENDGYNSPVGFDNSQGYTYTRLNGEPENFNDNE